MKLPSPRFWLGALSAIAVVTVALKDIGRRAPGPLTAVHGRVPELARHDSCSQCHGGWGSSVTEACSACHEDVEADIETGRGLHGVLHADVAPQCALCHSEHHGAQFDIVNARSFFIAGIPDAKAFDHQLIGFEMYGAHLELECSKCHEHAADEVIAEGSRRYMGLTQDCATCHEDPHDGSMSRTCVDCHGQETFLDFPGFEHDERFPLIGGHEAVGCLVCHPRDSVYAVETLAAFGAEQPRWRECHTCHQSPHENGFVEGVARLAEVTIEKSCVTCHEREHESFRDEDLTVTPEQHERSGFPLDAPHDAAACDDCHTPESPNFRERYPLRPTDACQHCHADPHGDQFDGADFAAGPFGDGCLACHERVRFEPHAFTAEKHGLTPLPLTGRHLEIECSACHSDPAAEAPRGFHGTPATCESCHSDAHAGTFAPVAAELVPHPNGDCARCHLASSFSDLPAEGFDHGQWTGFPVQGAHAQSDCETCHPRAAEADAAGRTFGRASEHFGTVTGCATCHADPHRGEFDTPELPGEVGRRTGCARCHVEISFRAFPQGFDHGTWTGFPLSGAHAEASCSACHEPVPRGDEHGRTWERAAGGACIDCHTDPHAEQFLVDGRQDCARCHGSTASFSELTFDHDEDSRFPLDLNHAELECAACHKRWIHRGREVVRYKPFDTECASCHGVDRSIQRSRRKKP